MKKLLTAPFRAFARATWKRKIVYLLLVILVIFFASRAMRPPAPTEQYTFAQVERGDIVRIISETGVISSNNLVEVYSESTGIVTELYVGNGEKVTKGQSIARIISTATEEEKASAYATYTNALSTLKTAEQNKITAQSSLEQARKSILDAAQAVKNMEDRLGASQNNPSTGKQYTQNEIDAIRSTETSTRQSFSAAEKKYQDSDTAITAARASVQSAKLSYQATLDSVLKATADGEIANLSTGIGQTVSAKTSGSAAGAAATTSSPFAMIKVASTSIAEVQINEVDINRVQSGQSVQITFDAVSDKMYTGTVSKVDYAGQKDSGVISYTVYIDILDGDSSLRPEMTANIDIESEKRTNVLLVPNNAVKPYQGGKAVQVPAERNDRGPRPSQPRYMPVKVGIVGTTHTEIIEGIDEGATIISGTAQTPREGGGGGILPVPGGAR